MLSRYVIILTALGTALLGNTYLAAQPYFENYFGNAALFPEGHGITLLPDSSIYYYGSQSNPQNNHDLFVFEMKPTGDTIRSFHLGNPYRNEHAGRILNDGKNLFLTGFQSDSVLPISYGFVYKTDTAGNILWQVHYAEGTKVIQLHDAALFPDGSLVVVGNITQPDMTANDFLVIKLDSLGNEIWQRRTGGNSNDNAMAVVALPDGGCLVSGDYFNDGYDNYILRYDSTGAVVWDLTIGDAYANGTQDLILDGNGNAVLIGESTTPEGPAFDIFMVSVTLNGQLNWAKYMGGIATEAGFSIVPWNNAYYFTGYSNTNTSGNGNINVILGKLNAAFEFEGIRYFPYNELTYGFQVLPSNQNGLYIAGFAQSAFLFYHADTTGFLSGWQENYLGTIPLPVSESRIYPNPASDILYLPEFSEYQIFTKKGELVLTGTGSTVPVYALVPGMYVVGWKTGKTWRFEKINIIR